MQPIRAVPSVYSNHPISGCGTQHHWRSIVGFSVVVAFVMTCASVTTVVATNAKPQEFFDMPSTITWSPTEPKQIDTVLFEREPLVQVVVEENVGPWNVSNGPKDTLGNIHSIYNFLTREWADALTWLRENYKESWPYGYPEEANPCRNMPPHMAIAIICNALRESEATTSAVEGGGLPVYSNEKHRAVGLWQVDGGIRWNYLRFADAQGKSYDDLETQLYFLAYSYYSYGEGFYQRWQKRIEAAWDLDLTFENTVTAAEAFRRDWEIGGYPGYTEEILANWGGKWPTSEGPAPEGGLYKYLEGGV